MTRAAQYARRLNAAPKGQQDHILAELDNRHVMIEVTAEDDLQVTFTWDFSQAVIETRYGASWHPHCTAREVQEASSRRQDVVRRYERIYGGPVEGDFIHAESWNRAVMASEVIE